MLPNELSIIDRYFRPLAGEGAFGLLDDAARLRAPSGTDIVVTADMIAEGVHFLPDDPPATIARKALRVNLSDLAAKGAIPLGYVLGAGLGSRATPDWLEGFAQALGADGRHFGIDLLGGDTIATGGNTVISVTAFGTVPHDRMVRRSGGTAGDCIYVSGEIGAAAAGLAVLQELAGPWDHVPASERDALVARYRVPEPRVGLALALVEFASAAMDVSDGLVGDCDKLAQVSGCTAEVDAADVPIPGSLRAYGDAQLLTMLLTGGDDYEILAAIPPAHEADFLLAAEQAGVPVTRIGTLREGAGPTDIRFQGRSMSVKRRAYEHGRDP